MNNNKFSIFISKDTHTKLEFLKSRARLPINELLEIAVREYYDFDKMIKSMSIEELEDCLDQIIKNKIKGKESL